MNPVPDSTKRNRFRFWLWLLRSVGVIAIFSVVHALMMKQLRVSEPERLVTFKEVLPDGFSLAWAQPICLRLPWASR
jgi:hypothetical protein